MDVRNQSLFYMCASITIQLRAKTGGGGIHEFRVVLIKIVQLGFATSMTLIFVPKCTHFEAF